MKKILIIVGLLNSFSGHAQDPHFSQFYASPFTLSPAETMNTSSDLRLKSNIREQWINPASPYFTGSLSLEKRILKKSTGENILGIGLGLMNDHSFDGILKSNYASVNVAYHQILDEDMLHQVSAGFGATYGKKILDLTRLVFASQFTSGGFDTNLLTGENSLSNTQSFISVSAGLSYAYNYEDIHVDLGVSGYHLNNPVQTFLDDQNQIVPRRYVVHSSFDLLTSQSNTINFCAVYQQQAKLHYYLFGGSYGFRLSEPNQPDLYLNIGTLYRWNDAVIPNVSLLINQFQAGLSYDATISKLSRTASKPKTFELSLSWFISKTEGGIKCPYSPFR